MFGCSTGVAVLDVHQIDAEKDIHAHVVMTMTRTNGKWLVAMDEIKVLDRTYF